MIEDREGVRTLIRNYRGKSLGAWVFGDLVSRKGSLPEFEGW